MDILRAKEIIECLADGVNPLTGQVFPPGGIPAIRRRLSGRSMRFFLLFQKKRRSLSRKMPGSHGQVRTIFAWQPCMMKGKHVRKYANISSVHPAELPRGWFVWGKYPTKMDFGKKNRQATSA